MEVTATTKVREIKPRTKGLSSAEFDPSIEFLKINEAVRYLRIRKPILINFMQQGLPFVGISDKPITWRFSKTAIIDWMKNRKQSAPAYRVGNIQV